MPILAKDRDHPLFEFGATRYFRKDWHVNAGYALNENSVPDAYYQPIVSDLYRHFFSAGTGFAGKSFDLDSSIPYLLYLA
jgi:hypothetical protein